MKNGLLKHEEPPNGARESQGLKENPKLRWFASFTAAATVFLIAAGASVTSTGSGDAVPDWPLSFGRLHPPQMVGGVFYEHGHRMVAGVVAALIAIQAVWLWRVEPRAWVRRLGWIALISVLLQAVLGGLRVLVVSQESLQDYAMRMAGVNHVEPVRIGIGVLHALLAQIVLSMTFIIALALSPGWLRHRPPKLALPKSAPKWAAFFVVALVLQLLVGGIMRHSGAGLIIPDFPLSHGKVVPPFNALPYDENAAIPMTYSELVFKTAMNFAHRTWAYVIAIGLIANMIWLARSGRKALGSVYTYSHLLAGLVFVQFFLGATTVWTERNVWVSVFHVATGATLFGFTVVYWFWWRRLRLEASPQAAVSPRAMEAHV